MNLEELKTLANHIAEQPFLTRRKMILRILKDLDKRLKKEEHKPKLYVV